MPAAFSIHERPASLLAVVRLPGRLNNEQAAEVLGFQPHDIPLLVKAGLLKPLGGGPRNCVKFYAACEIEQLGQDPKWLDKATKAISRRAGNNSKGQMLQVVADPPISRSRGQSQVFKQ
jgi:hypothetical protein